MNSTYTKALISYFETLVTPSKLQRIHEVLNQRTRHVSVVFEEPYHESNVSAILRSAEGLGVQDVHIIESYNRSAFKVGIARGSDQWLSIHRYTEKDATQECLQRLKNQGYQIVATVPDRDALPISLLPLDKPVALIFGNERLGISSAARAQADYLVTVPMTGFTESFNVSVAAAVMLYDLMHRLKLSSINWQLSSEEQYELELAWLRIIIPASEEQENRFRETYKQK